ncbi:hypothetical protein Efla_004715 [Eimeria flavescens]
MHAVKLVWFLSVAISIEDPLCSHRKKKKKIPRRVRRLKRRRHRVCLRAVLLDSAHGLLLETAHRMRSEVVRTATRRQRHLKRVVLREIAQVEGPLWCVQRTLYPRPFCLRRCLCRGRYRRCLHAKQIRIACTHLQQAIKVYLRWAGPDFRKFKAQRLARGDRPPRLCARVRCGCCCKIFWSLCCGLYCVWEALTRACRCCRQLCHKVTCCCRRHPDLLERRALCRCLCEQLEYEQELLTAHLAASYCYLAGCGLGGSHLGACGSTQLAGLQMAEAKELLRFSLRRLHKAHFPLCERPNSVSQRLVEVALKEAKETLEHAKAKVEPLPIRRPKPWDRPARERQFCLLPPGDPTVFHPEAQPPIAIHGALPVVNGPGILGAVAG